MSDSSPVQEIRGLGCWVAKRVGDRAVVSEPYGQWDAGERLYSISPAEFERLLADPQSARDILRQHEEGSGDGEGWDAIWWGRCTVHLRSSKFTDNRAFVIPREAFQRLKEDPAAFDEIYRDYRDDYA